MTVKEITKKFGLIDFEALATGAGQAEIEKRMKAVRKAEAKAYPFSGKSMFASELKAVA